MPRVGVRELKAHATTIVRQVREEGASFDVTYRGRVVARLTPVPEPVSDQAIEDYLKQLDREAEEIGKHWPPGVSALDAINDVRREL